MPYNSDISKENNALKKEKSHYQIYQEVKNEAGKIKNEVGTDLIIGTTT